ncbi:unnamed protein product [Fraxinus pennsylvanica]|uniref:Uncharacterized protein n=1 Tax=Fraxinus pennsylvanica TaxID=56036 RepID=A0AAD1YQ51_9LAMI|nr:unnamed protein product [Fraxinus pennsylvanica]
MSGMQKLDNLLGMNKPAENRHGLGYVQNGDTTVNPKPNDTNFFGSRPTRQRMVNHHIYRQQPPSMFESRFIPICHHCDVLGHTRLMCRKLVTGSKSQDFSSKVNFLANQDTPEIVEYIGVYNTHARVVMESINVVVDDVRSEGKIGEDCVDLEHLSVGPDIVTKSRETLVPDPSYTTTGLDTPNMESTPDDKSKCPKEPSSRVKTNHPKVNIIGDIEEGTRLRKRVLDNFTYASYVSQIEPTKVEEALRDEWLVNAKHEELNQFVRNKV